MNTLVEMNQIWKQDMNWLDFEVKWSSVCFACLVVTLLAVLIAMLFIDASVSLLMGMTANVPLSFSRCPGLVERSAARRTSSFA